MTPGARLAATIEVLTAIDGARTAADSLLRAYFRPRRYAGSKDRRAVGERVFAVIRHRARLDWWIAGAAGIMEPSPRLRVLAALMILDGTSLEAAKTLFSGEGHAPPPLDPEETGLAEHLADKPLHHDAMPIGVVHEVPQWLDGPLQDLWGDAFEREMAALNGQASVDLRVNTARVSREQARKSLSIDHVKSEPTALSPHGLRLTERSRLEDTRAFKKGLLEVQDEGSQLIALLCDARPGMTVVDYCAGAGGKTLALADIMGLQGDAPGQGSLIACDVTAKRLAAMGPRLKRCGVTGVRQIPLDEPDALAGLSRTADRVLVDAPCSGIGAWRRQPEARWRLTPERLAEHEEQQREVLRAAAGLVKPGGRLIYATCSLLPSENEEQVAAFLRATPDFTPLPVAPIWHSQIQAPCPSQDDALILSPAATGTDGFYCAVLERHPP